MKGIYLEVEGETKQELWENLVSLICQACEAKRNHGDNHEWPDGISSDAGMIKIVAKKSEGNG